MSRPLTPLLKSDVSRAAAAAVFGCLAWALVELVWTFVAASGPVGFGTALRFALLDLSLVAVAWLFLAPLVAAVAVATRLMLAVYDRDRAESWPGLLAPGQPAPAAASWLWALTVAGSLYLYESFYFTVTFSRRFKSPEGVAAVLALVQLGLFLVNGVLAYLGARGFAWLGRATGGKDARFHPLTRFWPALLAVFALATAAIQVLLRVLPQMAPTFPSRHLGAAAAFVAGLYGASRWFAWRGGLFPDDRRRRRIAIGASVGGGLAVVAVTLLFIGADPHTKFLAVTSSPPLNTMINTVRRANDFDGDGYGSLLGENDCGPFDAKIHPGARDIPDNNVDENCNGRDFSMSALPTYKKGERMPVPDEYLRDWNVLLLTIDTLRYDHTGFGGYREKSGRNTTPNLDKLVARSVSFTFAQAPSAGTMASVPAIQTSKFFHSGIALSGERRPKPPKVLDENTLLAEVMKRGRYRTGAILSHEYFNDWGLEQGFDTYDNEVGAKRDPFKITSHVLTDKALEWISRHSRQKWFLWVHYIDPHGRYVAHPGETSFGTSEMDLYDGEIAYTDKHLGRLFEELSRIPGGDRTIIVITSDHGDGFNEHGYINHGFALNRELLHVPLIVYVPDIQPAAVDGAVSALDAFPTIADLAGIDIGDLSVEGESLVPQLFYGKDAHDRVVFAETNAPAPQRAAITSKFKLIYKLKNNLYELYDLTADPWEKKNVYSKNKTAAAEMKGYLDDWLERVFYTRDPKTNQAAQKRAWHLLSKEPTPKHKLAVPLAWDEGRIEVLGYEVNDETIEAGKKLAITIYMRVNDTPSADFKFQAEAWQSGDAAAARPQRGSAQLTAQGTFPSSRWRPGEFVRDKIKVRVPTNWRGESFHIGMRVQDGSQRLEPKGPRRESDPAVGVLGTVGLTAPAKPATPAKPTPVAPPKRTGLAPIKKK